MWELNLLLIRQSLSNLNLDLRALSLLTIHQWYGDTRWQQVCRLLTRGASLLEKNEDRWKRKHLLTTHVLTRLLWRRVRAMRRVFKSSPSHSSPERSQEWPRAVWDECVYLRTANALRLTQPRPGESLTWRRLIRKLWKGEKKMKH